VRISAACKVPFTSTPADEGLSAGPRLGKTALESIDSLYTNS
jgi:hypothetical protein